MLIGNNGIDRYALFNGCIFYNFTGGGGASLTNAFSITTPGGDVVMLQSMVVGATALPASTSLWATPLADATTHVLKAVNPT